MTFTMPIFKKSGLGSSELCGIKVDCRGEKTKTCSDEGTPHHSTQKSSSGYSVVTWRQFIVGQLVTFFLVSTLTLALHLSLRFDVNNVRSELSLDRNSKMNVPDKLKAISKRSSSHPHAALLENNLQGLEVLQLLGALPAIQIKKNGTIGPWKMENPNTWATLSTDGSELRISNPGIYFIYAQVFYLTSETSNSFEIVRAEGKNRTALSVCANQATHNLLETGSSAEVSCYTGIVAHLQPPQRLLLNQLEQNRVIIFSSGFSHWGLIKLQ